MVDSRARECIAQKKNSQNEADYSLIKSYSSDQHTLADFQSISNSTIELTKFSKFLLLSDGEIFWFSTKEIDKAKMTEIKKLTVLMSNFLDLIVGYLPNLKNVIVRDWSHCESLVLIPADIAYLGGMSTMDENQLGWSVFFFLISLLLAAKRKVPNHDASIRRRRGK